MFVGKDSKPWTSSLFLQKANCAYFRLGEPLSIHVRYSHILSLFYPNVIKLQKPCSARPEYSIALQQPQCRLPNLLHSHRVHLSVVLVKTATPSVRGSFCFSIWFLILYDYLLEDPGGLESIFWNLSPTIDSGVRNSSYLLPAPSPHKPAGPGQRSKKNLYLNI